MSNRDLEKQSQEIFRKGMKEIPLSPFAAQRVMHILHSEEKRARQTSFWWKIFAVASGGVGVVTSVILFMATPQLSAIMGVPILMEVSLRSADSYEIAMTEIQLPPGVTFYSQIYPELNKQKKLQVPTKLTGTQYQLPVVIRSQIEGAKEILVRFMDANGRLVEEKKINIYFKKNKNSSDQI